MSTTPTPATPKPEKLVLGLEVSVRLAELMDTLANAKAAQDLAKQRYDDARDALLAEVTPNLVRGTQAGDSRIPDEFVLEGTPVRVSWAVTSRIDSKRLKADLPSVYAGYAKPSGAWRVTGL